MKKDFNYRRRRSCEVNVGGIPMGGDNPVRVQSMTSTSTMDTEGSVAQIKRIVEAGGEYVRLTAQGVREAANLSEIKAGLRADGVNVPLVADIHFNPKAAFERPRGLRKYASTRAISSTRPGIQENRLYRRGVCRRAAPH